MIKFIGFFPLLMFNEKVSLPGYIVLLFRREHRNLRVVRVELDSGERLVGLRYPDILISEAERYIKEQKLVLRQQTVSFFKSEQLC